MFGSRATWSDSSRPGWEAARRRSAIELPEPVEQAAMVRVLLHPVEERSVVAERVERRDRDRLGRVVAPGHTELERVAERHVADHDERSTGLVDPAGRGKREGHL